MAKGKKPTPQEIYWARKRKEEHERAALLPAGFINHGNTCFMNSVLQGLVATPLLEEIVRFRVPESFQPLASHRSPLVTNGRGLEDIQREWVRGMAIGDVFIHIMGRAWRMRDDRERLVLSPRELLSRLGEKYEQYLDFRQQDAHEFLLHLLDAMRMEELDIIKQRQPPLPKSSKSRLRATNGTARVLPEPIPEEDRLIACADMVFGGKLASVLICETCKHVSHTYEDFDDLSLSITHDESKDRKRDRIRAFATKFMSSSKSHDQGRSRPLSLSQPPSPSPRVNTLDASDQPLEAPRRRSYEASSSPEPTLERHKSDLFVGFSNFTGSGGIGEAPTHEPKVRSRKGSEAGLGRLGRKISVGMALSGKKEKKLAKAEKEAKAGISNATQANGKRGEAEPDGAPMSPVGSKAPSRQPSPAPVKKPQKERTRIVKLSEHDAQKAMYLRRLLADAVPSMPNPITALRMASPSSPGPNSAWLKVGAAQGVEDCLQMFTSVEALDGDNMFGCRKCWKIANGQISVKDTVPYDADSDDSSGEDEQQEKVEQPPRPAVAGPMQSFSMPNLQPGGVASVSSLSRSAKSSPFHTAFDPAPSETTGLDASTLDLNLGRSPSTSTTSFASTSHSQVDGISALGAGPRGLPIPTIAPVSPPPDGSLLDSLSDSLTTPTSGSEEKTPQPHRTHFVHFPNALDGQATALGDSLRLPPGDAHARYRHEAARDGESSLSSDDSEYDDISGVSDGDGSLVSTPNSAEPLPPPRSGIPRSKQVIYRRALKRYLIARPPPVLVIHLKRFQQVSKSPVTLFGNLKKLDEYVSFPEYLDIRPFLAPKKEDYGLGKGALRGKVVEKGKREEDQPCVYRLYAVVVHIGNMLGGHYIAYTALPSSREYATELRSDVDSNQGLQSPSGKGVMLPAKRQREWCCISDTAVRLASLEEVLKAKAYLCMYERVP